MRGQSKRILFAGTYERDCPRNGLTIAALDRAGFDVRELHAPVWERDRDKSGRYLRPGSLLRLGLRLATAYGSIGIRLIRALPDADAVVIGYIGQMDMLVLAPLAKLAGRPVVFNPLVTLTDTLVEDRQLARRGGPAAMVITLVDRLALRLADIASIRSMSARMKACFTGTAPSPGPSPNVWERGAHSKPIPLSENWERGQG